MNADHIIGKLCALPPVVWHACFELRAMPRPERRHRVGIIAGKARAFKDVRSRRDKANLVALIDAAHVAPPAPWTGPVRISIESRLPVFEGPAWRREAALAGLVCHTSKNRGDVDNLAKLVMDAMTDHGRWWKDDGQVVELHARKIYAAVPSTFVEVEFLEDVTREKWKERGAWSNVARDAADYAVSPLGHHIKRALFTCKDQGNETPEAT